MTREGYYYVGLDVHKKSVNYSLNKRIPMRSITAAL